MSSNTGRKRPRRRNGEEGDRNDIHTFNHDQHSPKPTLPAHSHPIKAREDGRRNTAVTKKKDVSAHTVRPLIQSRRTRRRRLRYRCRV
ncbi:hypothetical protein C8Q70DRAFT_974626 [Cubamyces menziesii]|nr:hypothetical protein C8Q70DRAFT_974626 [Cubamyces menziesii]